MKGMSKKDSERLEKFLQSNPNLLKKLRISHLLEADDLIERSETKIQESFQEHLERSGGFHDEVPLDYVLGDIVVGYYAMDPMIIIKMDLENLSGHIVAAAATGAGKSNWIMLLLHQIQNQHPNIPVRFIVFASKKGCEQRNLIVNNPPGTAFYLDKEMLALNPFSPITNVDANIGLADLARVLAVELGLMAGGQLYLQKCLFEFLKKYKDENLIAFVEWISNKKESSMDYRGYKDRLVVRLESIMYEIGHIFDCYTGIPDSAFVEENIVLELPCSSSFIMSVVSGIILSRMFRFKAANPEFMRYKNLIVLEDILGSLRYE